MCNGVSPSRLCTVGLHSSQDNSWTTASFSWCLTAICNGVFIWRFTMFGLHLWSVTRYLTIPTSPHWHAIWSKQSPSLLMGIIWAVPPFLFRMTVLHLFSRRSLITPENCLRQAMCSGVSPSLFWASGSHCLWANNLEIAAVLFIPTAMCSGVKPCPSWELGLHFLLDNSWATASFSLRVTAMCSGVSPFVFWPFGLHCLWANMWVSAAILFSLTAVCNGVSFCAFWSLTLHLPEDNKWRIISSLCSCLTAMCNGLSPSLFKAFGSHCLWANSLDIAAV